MDLNSDPDLRALLAQVAAGTVAPEEASQRIAAGTADVGEEIPISPAAVADEAIEGAAARADQPASAKPAGTVRLVPNPTANAGGARSDSGPIERVVIRATAVKLVLLGDPTVTGASVEGPHVARRDGGALIIDTDADPAPGDFSYEPNAQRAGRPFGRWRGGETVLVKVRPDLPVEVAVMAGSIVATRLRGGLRFTVDAGSIKAMDCAGPIDGRVASGSAKLDWQLQGGSSRLRCELGSIKVTLDRDSDVTVKAHAELGSVDLGKSSASGANATRELVVGRGSGTLDIDVSLGSAKVQVA